MNEGERKKRIGLDARFLGPQNTGLGRYTQQLISHLEKIESPHEYIVFLRKDNFDVYTPRNPQFKKVIADFPWYGYKEQFAFPKEIQKHDIDLMHFFHFNVPIFYKGPYIVTIHDLILLNYPTRKASTLLPFHYAIKYAAFRYVISKAITRADQIICVSEYTREQVHYHFDVPTHRVHVVSESVGPSKKGQVDKVGGFPKQYFLYVGNSYPHKNLDALLESILWYRNRGGTYPLVLVGKRDYFSKRLEQKVIHMGLTIGEDVIFYGFASDEQLQRLYEGASVYVFPSLEEGFGLPPLEAMQFGVPVISSYTSSLPEVLKTKAYYVNPHDVGDIGQALVSMEHDNSLRILFEKLAHKSYQYTWNDCARETLAIYQNSHAR